MAPTFWKVGGFPTAGGAAGGRSRVTAALARAPRNRHAQRARSHPTRLHRERLDSLPRSPSCSFACCVRRFAATSARGADEPHRHRRAPPDDRAPRRSLRRLLPPRSCRLTRAAAWTLVIFSTHTRARRVSRAARVLAVLGRALARAGGGVAARRGGERGHAWHGLQCPPALRSRPRAVRAVHELCVCAHDTAGPRESASRVESRVERKIIRCQNFFCIH